MTRFFFRLVSSERGATAIEYGLIIASVGLTVAFAGGDLVDALIGVVDDVVNASNA